MNGNFNDKIDEELYSRQIIFLGMDTMKKISNLKILIIGVRGLGIEISKDIIVSGPNEVTIFDPNEVKIEDLGSNFYLSEKDIGKRRDESCLDKLKMLNKYVNVNFLEETSIKNIMVKIQGKNNFIVLLKI
jgi:ubiquitin-activating enzyme E1